MRYLEIGGDRQRNLNWDVINIANKYNLPGIRSYDITDLPIPFVTDETYDGIYSEHIIEHLYRYQGINLFKEAYRILKPGGILRTAWPAGDVIDWLVSREDLEQNSFVVKYHERYVANKNDYFPCKYQNLSRKRKQEQVALGLLSQKNEHKHLWYVSEMINELQKIGFVNAKQVEHHQSSVFDFRGLENPDTIRMAHTYSVEAFKP